MLNALALTLLSIQFIAPPAMVALIVVVPALYALQVRLLPASLWPLAGLTGLLLALLLFGPDTAIWALVYMLLGLVCGVGQRLSWPRVGLILLTGLACTLALAGLVLLFGALVRLDWNALRTGLAQIAAPLGVELPLLPLAAGALSLWALLIAVGVEWMAGSIFARLRATQSGIVVGER
jgi:hypothetical protein